jgi:hypothetical protein
MLLVQERVNSLSRCIGIRKQGSSQGALFPYAYTTAALPIPVQDRFTSRDQHRFNLTEEKRVPPFSRMQPGINRRQKRHPIAAVPQLGERPIKSI